MNIDTSALSDEEALAFLATRHIDGIAKVVPCTANEAGYIYVGLEYALWNDQKTAATKIMVLTIGYREDVNIRCEMFNSLVWDEDQQQDAYNAVNAARMYDMEHHKLLPGVSDVAPRT